MRRAQNRLRFTEINTERKQARLSDRVKVACLLGARKPFRARLRLSMRIGRICHSPPTTANPVAFSGFIGSTLVVTSAVAIW
jgi:hypothetical protein